jgi:hypothetical protein
VTIILGVVAALAALGAWFYNNNEGFRNAVDAIRTSLSDLLQTIVSKAQGLLARVGVPRAASGFFTRGALASYATIAGGPLAGAWAWGASNDNAPPRSFARPGAGGRTGEAPIVVNMDGQRVGEIVSGHQGAAARRPSASGSSHDPRVSPAPAAAGHSR